MDHEHIFEKIGTWRKYDFMECQYIGPAKKHKRTKSQETSKESKVPAMCSVKQFALTQKPRLNKKSGLIVTRPPVFVSVHPQNNGFWKREYRVSNRAA